MKEGTNKRDEETMSIKYGKDLLVSIYYLINTLESVSVSVSVSV